MSAARPPRDARPAGRPAAAGPLRLAVSALAGRAALRALLARLAARSGPLLLAAVVLAMLPSLLGWMRATELRERAAAARMVLDDVGAAIAAARGRGVPAQELVGLDELLDARLPADSGVTDLRLVTADGTVLWRRAGATRGTGGAAAPGVVVLDCPAGDGLRLVAGFAAPGAGLGAALEAAAVLAVVAAALAVPLAELARYLDARLDGFARHYLELQVRALRARDFRATWRLRGLADPRLHFLRNQVLLLNERYRRLGRLVESLRRTEPDPGRRERIQACLAEVDARFHFIALPIEHAVRPAGVTARGFAVLALVLAGRPGVTAVAALAPGAALAAWAAGAAIAAAWAGRSWTVALRAAFVLAAFGNFAAEWSGVAAALAAGAATALAFEAGIVGARAQPAGGWRGIVPALARAAMAGLVVGQATALATDSPWPGRAFALAALAAVAALAVVAPRDGEAGGLRRPPRPDLQAVAAGAALAATLLLFVLRADDAPSTTLLALAAAAPLALCPPAGRLRRRLPLALAALLAALLAVPAWRGGAASLLGAALAAGAVLRPRAAAGARRVVAGMGVGAVGAAAAIALAAPRLAPAARDLPALLLAIAALAGQRLAARRPREPRR